MIPPVACARLQARALVPKVNDCFDGARAGAFRIGVIEVPRAALTPTIALGDFFRSGPTTSPR
jgi:hypothetical protein